MIRSVLTYAAAGWAPWISETATMQLIRADYRALRLVSGLLTTAPAESITIEAGMANIRAHIEYLIGKSYAVAQCLPELPESRAEIFQAHNIGAIEQTTLSPTGLPPWQIDHSSQIVLCWQLKGRGLKKLPADQCKKIGGTAQGGSATVVWNSHQTDVEPINIMRLKGRRWTCSFETEIAALQLAKKLTRRPNESTIRQTTVQLLSAPPWPS